ncbi:hypothetical protein BgiBS90_023943 [Biomphalaria glabrata]|nr:hypothetical protein BgiBS90_023943 [Biomphalaria glabrata]
MELDPYHPDYYLDNIDFFGEPATNFSSSYSMSKAKQVFFAAVPTRLTYNTDRLFLNARLLAADIVTFW